MVNGKLNLQEIEVALPEEKSASVIELSLNKTLVDVIVKKEGDKTIVIFESVVLVENDFITDVIKSYSYSTLRKGQKNNAMTSLNALFLFKTN